MVKIITDINTDTNEMIIMFQKKYDITLKRDAVKLILEQWADEHMAEFHTSVRYGSPPSGVL